MPQFEFTIDGHNYYYQQQGTSIMRLVETMNGDALLYSLSLVIDETDFKKPLAFELKPRSIGNINDWKKELKKIGFDLVEEEREINMLAIEEIR